MSGAWARSGDAAMSSANSVTGRRIGAHCCKKGALASALRSVAMGVLLERHAHTELSKALLALSRVAGIEGRLLVFRRRAIADEARFILRVEHVKDFTDQFHSVVAKELECPGGARIHLRERRATKRIHVADAGRQIEPVAVAVEIGSRPIGVRRCRVIAKNARQVDAEGRAIQTTQCDTMTRVGVERPRTGTAERIIRIDALIPNRAQIRLVTSR